MVNDEIEPNFDEGVDREQKTAVTMGKRVEETVLVLFL
jgi:hypothetical protein